MDSLAAGAFPDVGSLAETVDPVSVDDWIGVVLHRLDHGEDAVPIADHNHQLVGWVRQQDMLAALSLRPS
jgi:CBS-domain-containing membrane protein